MDKSSLMTFSSKHVIVNKQTSFPKLLIISFTFFVIAPCVIIIFCESKLPNKINIKLLIFSLISKTGSPPFESLIY